MNRIFSMGCLESRVIWLVELSFELLIAQTSVLHGLTDYYALDSPANDVNRHRIVPDSNNFPVKN